MSDIAAPELSPLKRALIALDEMQIKLEAAQRRAAQLESDATRREPIAVVGIGCRLPGGADSPDAFWRLLTDGVDAITEVPADRWDIDSFYDADPDAPGKMSTRCGGFLADVSGFDPQFFGISAREAVSMDPQQRLLLEVAWEALEHAGIAPDGISGSRTGVFVGMTSGDYASVQMQATGVNGLDTYYTSGIAHSVASGRLSYVLGLQGPSITLDTACSSSLVAVHLAVRSLRTADCRMALAGGVNLILSPENSIMLSKYHMLAPDGRCKAFDASADGFVRGEGCALVVLKRLADAVADGDRVLAVIRGSAVNQDGPSSGLTAPNGPAQEDVIRAALVDGGVAANEVGYVEAHGTGTELGDPIEVQALAAALGPGRAADAPLAIGSVKTNIGHLEGVAGVAGLIKAILVLQNGFVPPHLHVQELNPHIDWPSLPIVVPAGGMAWTAAGPRFAGVSAFGFSGTNVHVVLEGGTVAPPCTDEHAEPPDRPQLLVLSASTEPALRDLAERHAAHLAANPGLPLADVCATANAGRARLRHRLAVVADSAAELQTQLVGYAAGEQPAAMMTGEATSSDPRRIAFLFTGQGAQHPGMARSLYGDEPVFRAALDQCAASLAGEIDVPLLTVMFAEEGTDAATLLDQTSYTQPALFALEYALTELWRSWGVVPQALLGHSIGEYVAAVVAGVLDLDGALRLVAARGRLMQQLPPGGAMAAVFAPQADVEAAVSAHDGAVSIAAVNGPAHLVVSGDEAAVGAIVDGFVARGVRVQQLAVSHAFHSPLMLPMLAEFTAVAAGFTYHSPQRRVISNHDGQPMGAAIADAQYWVRHVIEPVQFAAGVETLRQARYDTYLEIGPHPVLTAMAQAALPDVRNGVDDAVFVPSLRRKRADRRQLLESLGALFVAGVDIDWAAVAAPHGTKRIALPTYPFQRRRCWVHQARPAIGASSSGHPLLGHRLSSPLETVTFESRLAVDSFALLDHHRVFGTAILPATAFLEAALGAGSATRPSGGPLALDDVVIHQAFVADDDLASTLQTIISPGVSPGDDGASFTIFSRRDGDEDWTRHATGRVGGDTDDDPAPPHLPVELAAVRARCVDEVTAEVHYETLRDRGLDFGPSLRGVRRIWTSPDKWLGEALGEIELAAEQADETDRYRIHPALLDSAIQLLAAVAPDGDDTYLPVGVDRVTLRGRAGAQALAHAVLRPHPTGAVRPETLTADIVVCDGAGAVLAAVEGVHLKRADRNALLRLRGESDSNDWADPDGWLYEVAWREAEGTSNVAQRALLPSAADLVEAVEGASLPADRCRWLIVGGGAAGGVGDHLAGRIAARGGTAVVASVGDDVARLLGDSTVDGVVHLASIEPVTDDANDDNDDRGRDRLMQRRLGSALALTQAMVNSGSAARLWLVTRGAQPAGSMAPDADQAPLWGFAASVRLEHPELHTVSLDLDPSPAADTVVDLLDALLTTDAEDQVAVRGGRRLVARLMRQRSPLVAAPVELAVGQRGTLDDVSLRPLTRRAPGSGEVEMRVHASALNFKDVLNALGMYPGDPGPLGGECAGIVTAVGSDVEGLHVGEAVIALGSGCLRSHVTCSADFVVPKPASLSFSDASALAIANVTADFALRHAADVRPGERVLIHAAAGGVGLAAVGLAQRLGAEIYATAGSDRKRAVLAGLGVRHVYDSRTLAFAEEIMTDTGGEGVDIVLNSLAGEFVGRSLAVLRDGGRFLEIGKRDQLTAEAASRLGRGISYDVIDWGKTAAADPGLIRNLLMHVVESATVGTIAPLPTTVFTLDEAQPALRFMAQARHIGKVVLTQPAAIHDGPARGVGPDATYLVTGGLSGLGLLTAQRLCDLGARHLILIGRRPPSAETLAVIAGIEAGGAQVAVVQGDVAVRADVQRVLALIESSMPPLRGVFHAAGALDDGALTQQTWSRFESVLAAKVSGARQLHELTAGSALDHFVLYASIASVLGSAGQANYAAANAYLDALAHRRAACGQTALSVDWGAWGEVGLAAARGIDVRAAGHGVGIISPEAGMDVLERLMARSAAQVAVLPVRWATLLQRYAAGVPPYFAKLVGNGERNSGARRPQLSAAPADLRTMVEAAGPHRRGAIVLEFVREQSARVLGLAAGEVADGAPLSDLGLDSLMAVELRNLLGAALVGQRPLPATTVFDYPTVAALAGHIADVIGIGIDSGEHINHLPERTLVGTLLDDMDDLSDDEIDRLIEQRAGR